MPHLAADESSSGYESWKDGSQTLRNGNEHGKKPQKGNVRSETFRMHSLPEQYPAVSAIQHHEAQHSKRTVGSTSHEVNPTVQSPYPLDATAHHSPYAPTKAAPQKIQLANLMDKPEPTTRNGW